jgi:hypothetical protein
MHSLGSFRVAKDWKYRVSHEMGRAIDGLTVDTMFQKRNTSLVALWHLTELLSALIILQFEPAPSGSLTAKIAPTKDHA